MKHYLPDLTAIGRLLVTVTLMWLAFAALSTVTHGVTLIEMPTTPPR